MQRSEWEAAMALPQKPFNPNHKVELLEGDKDLFDDGRSSRHPAIQLGTGDAVHFQSNWDNLRVPGFNADREKTLAFLRVLWTTSTPNSGSITTSR
jgi:hypothetical protein